MNKSICILIVIVTAFAIQGCSSPPKDYENTVFPDASTPWRPVNPEHFDKTEAQRIFEGGLIK